MPRINITLFPCLLCCWLAYFGPSMGAQEARPGRALRPQQAMGSTVPKTEFRYALVIGNSSYRDSPLANPVQDARAISRALKQCGFSVRTMENATYQQMWAGVREFGYDISNGGTGLFFYAGHGMQIKGRNFLMPVDAVVSSEDEVQFKALDVGSVLEKMENAKNRLNILILDACRNNPFARSWRSSAQGLATMDPPTGSFIAFATAPGKTAADGNGENGLFTSHLLGALNQDGLKIEEVFKMVRIGVKRESRDQQIPWDNSSLVEDFYFRPPAHAAQASAAPDVQLMVDKAELNYWNAIKSSNQLAKYNEYIRLYPNGYFVSVARNKIDFLQPTSGLGQALSSAVTGLSGSLVLTEKNRKVCEVVGGDPVQAGSLDGIKHKARLSRPAGVEVDPMGNVFAADSQNGVIRKIDPEGRVSIFAGDPAAKGCQDGPAASATFTEPTGLLLLPSGALLVFDPGSAVIRRIENGVVTTFAGRPGKPGHSDGSLAGARFIQPVAGAQDSQGNILVADRGDHAIRRISPRGRVTTFAGSPGNPGCADGFSGDASFDRPGDLAIDANDNVFVLDQGSRLIRRIDRKGVVQTFAGSGAKGPATDDLRLAASFNDPAGLCSDHQGGLFVVDEGGYRLRHVDPQGKVTTVIQIEAGDLAINNGPDPCARGIRWFSADQVVFSFGNSITLAKVNK